MTWEWAAGLRSYAHPLLFAGPYAVLRALRLDSAWAVVRVPLLLQALAATATDLYVASTAALLFGQGAARWAPPYAAVMRRASLLGGWQPGPPGARLPAELAGPDADKPPVFWWAGAAGGR